MMMSPLEGKNVVITGGAGALGEAVVARFVKAGAICHVPSRRPVGADSPLAGNAQVKLVEGVDLADEKATDRFFDGVPDLWASMHLAGGFAMAALTDTSREDFMRMMDMNAATVFSCCRAAVRNMRKAGHGGRIVNVSARPGLDLRKGAGMAAYAASKAAVAAITLALAEELKKEAILVNAVAPSTIDTPANRNAMPNADTSKWLSPKAVAEAIVHLASPTNMEVNGAILPLYARV